MKTFKSIGKNRFVLTEVENNFDKLSAENPEHRLAQSSSEEQPHDETDMSNPEEAKEVQIGRKIQRICESVKNHSINYIDANEQVYALAVELIKMHGAKV